MEFPATVAHLIYSPYIDLFPAHVDAPFHVHGLAWAAEEALDGISHGFIQASVNASFREELTTGQLSRYAATSPQDVGSAATNDRWRELQRLSANISRLNRRQALAVCWTTSRLGFHSFALELLARLGDGHEEQYLRAWCLFRLSLDGAASHDHLDFAKVYEISPPGVTKVDSAYQMVKHYAKSVANLDKAMVWQRLHGRAIDEFARNGSHDEISRLRSRYHRVGGFLPQLQNDPAGVADEMGSAEEIARLLRRDTDEQRMLADEMLYPCIESRIKEAIWIDDFSLAHQRANEYMEMRPLDPKGWFHLGDVNLSAAKHESALHAFSMAEALAPPGAAIAQFMQGVCHESMGDMVPALACYVKATSTDPLAISAFEGAERAAAKFPLMDKLGDFTRNRRLTIKNAR